MVVQRHVSSGGQHKDALHRVRRQVRSHGGVGRGYRVRKQEAPKDRMACFSWFPGRTVCFAWSMPQLVSSSDSVLVAHVRYPAYCALIKTSASPPGSGITSVYFSTEGPVPNSPDMSPCFRLVDSPYIPEIARGLSKQFSVNGRRCKCYVMIERPSPPPQRPKRPGSATPAEAQSAH